MVQAKPSFGSVQPSCSHSALAQERRACGHLWDSLKVSGCFSSIAPEVSHRLGMVIMACVRLTSDGWAEPVADGHVASPGWMLKLSVQDGLEQPLTSQTAWPLNSCWRVISLSSSLPLVLKWFEFFVIRNNDRHSEFWFLELFLNVLWVTERALQGNTAGPHLSQITAARICLVHQLKRHLFLAASHGNSTGSLEVADVTHAPCQVQRHRSCCLSAFPPPTSAGALLTASLRTAHATLWQGMNHNRVWTTTSPKS